ncbi:MAG TPA: TetR family transcriptional regulator [Bryobacteraceae bacterium]|nr:TetR family transcriptional regulator [Bryobacteraceae bacterium]
MTSRRAQILVAVREMILRGELPARKTIEEIELSRKLGASRPIVRVTLERLSQEGLLEERPEGGYAPRVFTRQDIADAIEARGALEGLAAGRAARRVTDPAELGQARRINAELAAAAAMFGSVESPTAEQMARFGELNLAFHQALIALAKSPMLQLALERVQSIAFASPAAVVTPAETGGFSRAIREHDEILHAIQTGDPVRAENLVREHARFALRGVKNALDRPSRLPRKTKVDLRDRSETTAKGAPRQTELAGPTSELVLDAAAALFGEKGFSETTTRAIAARLNIHQASLYYHISTKEDLLYRLSRLTLETVEQHVRRAIGSHHNSRDRLSALIQAHLQGLFENPHRALAAISEYRSLSRAHHKELTELRGNYSDLLDKELASAVKAGIVRKDVPVAVLRLGLLNYLNWTPRWYHLSGPLPLDELARIYDRVFFEGIAAPGQSRPSAPQPQNPRRTRSRPAHRGTLGKFVRTAAELFSKQGYASTSTRSISKLIGMEKATLYYHVKSKEDLLYLITKSSVEALRQDVQKALEGMTCPLDQLAALIKAHCMSLLLDHTQHATALAEVRGLSSGRLTEIVAMRKAYQKEIRQIIDAGQKSGALRIDAQPRYLAAMLQGLLDRVVEWYQKGGPLGPGELAGYLCDIYLFGVSASRTPSGDMHARQLV